MSKCNSRTKRTSFSPMGAHNKLVFCGDILRANPDLTFNQAHNVRWFSSIFRGSIAPLFDEILITDSDLAGMPYEDFYRCLYGTAGEDVLDKWASLYNAEHLPSCAIELLTPVFRNAFVVAFEAPPVILRYFNKIDVTYINVRVHPLRYMSDLVLSFSSNNPTLTARMKIRSLSTSFVAAETNYIRSRFANTTIDLPPEAVIFLAQTSMDSSVIGSGGFFSLRTHQDRLRNHFAGRPIFLKPHPNEMQSRFVKEWRDIFPEARTTELNTYAIFSQSENCTFVTLSSGSGYEAQKFGHSVMFLSDRNVGKTSSFHSDYAHILYEYWCPGFWRFAIRGDASALHDLGHFVPNRLREVIGYSWSKTF